MAFRKGLTIAQVSNASVSLLASSTIVMIIYRSGLTNPYRRLIFGLSMSDILQSFAISFGPWLAPHDDEGSLWAFGNKQTCELVGFFFAYGMTAVPMYTLGLCVYYVCKLRTRMADEHFAHRIERPIHAFIITVNLVIYLTAVGVGAMDTLPFKNGCYLASRKGKIARGLIFFNSLIVPIVCLAGIVLCMMMILWHVLMREKIFGPAPSPAVSRESGSIRTGLGSAIINPSSWRLRNLRPRALSSFGSLITRRDNEGGSQRNTNTSVMNLRIDDINNRISEDDVDANTSIDRDNGVSEHVSFPISLSSKESEGYHVISKELGKDDKGQKLLSSETKTSSSKKSYCESLDPEGQCVSRPESLSSQDHGDDDLHKVSKPSISKIKNDNQACIDAQSHSVTNSSSQVQDDPEIQANSTQPEPAVSVQLQSKPEAKFVQDERIESNHGKESICAVNSYHSNSNINGSDSPLHLSSSIATSSNSHLILERNQEEILRVYKRELVGQACCYVLVFCVTALPFITQTFIFMSGNIPPASMIWAMTFTFNLGGLFNILVYTRPKVSSLRRRYPDCSRLQALYLVLRAGGEVPDVSVFDGSKLWFSWCKRSNGDGNNGVLVRHGVLVMPRSANIPRQETVSALQIGRVSTPIESSLDSIGGMNGLSQSFESSNAAFRPSQNWDYIEGEGSVLNVIEEEEEDGKGESSSHSSANDALSEGRLSSTPSQATGKKADIDDDWAATFDRVRTWKPSEG